MGAAFQPWRLEFLVFVGLVPLFVALERAAAEPSPLRAAFRAGFAFGMAYFGVMAHWILFLTSNQLPHQTVMIPLFLLLAAYLALYPALFAFALAACARRTRIPVAILAPPLWVASEWLRASGEMGFPWGEAGYALTTHLPLLQSAAWVGVSGLSLVAVAANGAVRHALRRGARARFVPAAAAAALLAALHAAGSARLAAHPPAQNPSFTVAVLQPNIAQGIKWDWESLDKSVDAIARLSRRIAFESADLAVWPETAIPAYLREQESYARIVRAIVAETGAPTLLGFPDSEIHGDERLYFNSALYLLPDGSDGGDYRKMHLVPFGEALPFQGILPALRKVDFGEADFTPGTEKTLFTAGEARFGVAICFEAIFPAMTRDLVRRGAQVIVTITNDAWYGRSSAAWQHARMSLVRSVEDGVHQVRSANTGISFVSDPFGRVLAETGLFVEDLLMVPIEPACVPTFYLRHGDLSLLAALAVTAVALAGALLPLPLLSRNVRRGS